MLRLVGAVAFIVALFVGAGFLIAYLGGAVYSPYSRNATVEAFAREGIALETFDPPVAVGEPQGVDMLLPTSRRFDDPASSSLFGVSIAVFLLHTATDAQTFAPGRSTTGSLRQKNVVVVWTSRASRYVPRIDAALRLLRQAGNSSPPNNP